MATTKNKEAADKVTIKLPFIRGYKENDVVCSLNGKITQIQRGKEVTISRDLAEILAEQERLEIIADDYIGKKAE